MLTLAGVSAAVAFACFADLLFFGGITVHSTSTLFLKLQLRTAYASRLICTGEQGFHGCSRATAHSIQSSNIEQILVV